MLLGYTHAVDVWAAGVLAYELLVGRPPFERESREETQHYIATREPLFPAWLSEGARDFIRSALAKVGVGQGGWEGGHARAVGARSSRQSVEPVRLAISLCQMS